ncbi:MAG: hypothetical protein Q9162_005557 [Coniocarpon cinnabarinum]
MDKEKVFIETGDKSPVDSETAAVINDDSVLSTLGYKPELHRNRSLLTLLFQSLAIAAIPYGEGGPLLSAIYGGGQLSIFLGWVRPASRGHVVRGSIDVNRLFEIASRYPTAAGPYYWSYQLAGSHKELLSFVTGWIWLVGNVTITLSVNFGFASILAATVSISHPNFEVTDWQLLLIFYAILLVTFVVCVCFNRWLPLVDVVCAAWTAISILIILIALAAKAATGRHDADYALGHYDKSLSGWGGFTFFIGLLPAAYCFSAIGSASKRLR